MRVFREKNLNLYILSSKIIGTSPILVKHLGWRLNTKQIYGYWGAESENPHGITFLSLLETCEPNKL